MKRATVFVVFLLAMAGIATFGTGCGGQGSTSTAPVGAPTSSLAPTSTEATPPESAAPLAEVWAASLAAVEALGPTRVEVVETTQGRVLGDDVAPENATFGPQISDG